MAGFLDSFLGGLSTGSGLNLGGGTGGTDIWGKVSNTLGQLAGGYAMSNVNPYAAALSKGVAGPKTPQVRPGTTPPPAQAPQIPDFKFKPPKRQSGMPGDILGLFGGGGGGGGSTASSIAALAALLL